jgi:hypothetical protein
MAVNTSPNPSGDPRLDPAFLRKHGGRHTEGFEKRPVGKAIPTRTYQLNHNGRELTFRTKALSRFLVVGVIAGRGVILFRCKRVEKATEIMRNQNYDNWRWLRVIDQKTGEVLVLDEKEKELVRENG